MVAIERPRVASTSSPGSRRTSFSTWYNVLLTLLALALIFVPRRALFSWVFLRAEWQVIAVNLRLFMIGTFPIEQVWRVWLCVALAAALLGAELGDLARGGAWRGRRLRQRSAAAGAAAL